MKTILAIGLVSVGLNLSALGNTISNVGFDNGQAVPDGTLNGLSDNFTPTTPLNLSGPITGVTVTLNVSGGYVGDLYAYLVHPTGPNSGGFAVLLNRVGVSSSDSFGNAAGGLNVKLAATGTDIHTSPTFPSGNTFQADGRNISPLSEAAAFDSAGTAGLGSFNGMNPNGTWVLYVADVVSGGGTFTLNSWGLDITTDTTTIPDTAFFGLDALVAFAGLLMIYANRRARSAKS